MVKCCVCFLVIHITVTHLQSQIKYPITPRYSQVDDYHGIQIEDPYRWLENDTSAATGEWVNKQNQITTVYLESIPFRHKLRKRMAAFYNYPRYSAPFRNGTYYYYFKNDGLQNHSVLYRQLGLDGKTEIVINPNEFSADGSIQLVGFAPSKDGKYAAWGISASGSDWQTYFVRDLSTMKDLTDTIRWVKLSDIAWQKNGFYYSRYPEPEKGKELTSMNEDHQVWYHTVGTPQSEDRLIFRDTANPYRFYSASTSRDERYIFLSISDRGRGLDGNALLYADCENNDKNFKPIVAEVGEYIYGVIDPSEDHKFLIQTNDHAPNSKVMLFDPVANDNGKWKTLIPEKNDPLKIVTMAGGKLFAQYLKDVASKVYAYSTNGKLIREIELSGHGDADGFEGFPEDTLVFYTYNALNYPTHIFQYNTRSGKSTLFRRPEIIFNPDHYTLSRQFFNSKDGTRVPMFLVHKKGLKRNGRNPTLLYGYGGFNVSLTPRFNNSLMPWLEQGGIFALVNLRGGGEYGEKWHQAGMLDKKQNVFDDFISAAEYLIHKKYTSSQRLAIRGASNGGLLIGAVINQRPDLFKVAIPEVGVMDMLRFQKFTIGWNWIAEYGSSDNKKDFSNLIKYSPVHNVRTGKEYPATLIITADHDDRVVPAHSFKYAATLQEKYKGKNPVLLKIDTNSGHGLSSILNNIELASDIFSFILFNMGVQWQDIK